MPMKKDPQNGGTNSDGSKNTEYCGYCYKDGTFTSSEIKTPQAMQKFCIGKLKEKGMPGVVAWLFTRSIPRLRRWTTK